jgi:hypothetical protein
MIKKLINLIKKIWTKKPPTPPPRDYNEQVENMIYEGGPIPEDPEVETKQS